MARAGLAMRHTLSCTSTVGDELQKIEVVCYARTGTSRWLDWADAICWPGLRHAVLCRVRPQLFLAIGPAWLHSSIIESSNLASSRLQ
jgi:hypothetical protein